MRVGGLTVLGARTYDPVTRQFLSPDPLDTVPATNGAASAYTYAWQDPINHVDPTGMQPVSIEAYAAILQREEHGRLGQAWEAIKEDPWGTLAAVGVVALGVGLCFTPFAAVGAGILIGAAVSSAAGLASGTFDPRAVAVSGVIGGLAGGAGAAFSSTSASLATGGAIGFGGDVAMQATTGQPINWNRALVSGGVGIVTAGIGSSTSSATNTALRSAAAGSATDAGADIATQALTGDGHIDLGSVAFSAISGGGTSAVTHHLTTANTSSATIVDPVEAPKHLVYDQMPLFVETPYGLAVQGTDPASLAARDHVLNGGDIFKGGNVNSIGPEQSQFFALEHPETAGFGDKYGIPPKNLPFDWVGQGTLESSAPFVTRPAPGVDVNAGGGVEVVTLPGSFVPGGP